MSKTAVPSLISLGPIGLPPVRLELDVTPEGVDILRSRVVAEPLPGGLCVVAQLLDVGPHPGLAADDDTAMRVEGRLEARDVGDGLRLPLTPLSEGHHERVLKAMRKAGIQV